MEALATEDCIETGNTAILECLQRGEEQNETTQTRKAEGT